MPSGAGEAEVLQEVSDYEQLQTSNDGRYRDLSDIEQGIVPRKRSCHPSVALFWIVLVMLIAISILAVRFVVLPSLRQSSTSSSSSSFTVSNSVVSYNCQASAEWEAQWPMAQRKWCCQAHQLGCLAFNCEVVGNWEQAWSDLKKEWCGVTSHGLATSSEPFDCEANYLAWMKSWSQDKKDWCCDNKRQGCLMTTTPAVGLVGPCEVSCHLDGVTATCYDRILYAVRNNYAGQQDACGLAFNRVRGECEMCDQCSKEVNCSPLPLALNELDCDEGLDKFEMNWSPEKKAWCCEHASKACSDTLVS